MLIKKIYPLIINELLYYFKKKLLLSSRVRAHFILHVAVALQT